MRLFLALLMLLVPGFAWASPSVSLESAVFVERTIKETDGRTKIILESPGIVVPGDQYQNRGATPAADFTVTNPMPSAVAFQGTGDPAAQISVNGGRDWGTLDTLKIRETDGSWRSARPEDVTHVRWPVAKAIPVGATGRLSFRGIVR
jgi:hypothetical protein